MKRTLIKCDKETKRRLVGQVRFPVSNRPTMIHKPLKGHGSYNRPKMKRELKEIINNEFN